MVELDYLNDGVIFFGVVIYILFFVVLFNVMVIQVGGVVFDFWIDFIVIDVVDGFSVEVIFFVVNVECIFIFVGICGDVVCIGVDFVFVVVVVSQCYFIMVNVYGVVNV